jgi:CheY-like chemotaxis protein
MAAKAEILVVEDDADTARYLVTLLVYDGYSVADVPTLAQAYEWLSSHETPKVAIIDINLPNGNGTMLVDELKRAHPGCLVIVATGYPEKYWECDIKGPGPDHVVMKPIRFPELRPLLPEPLPRPT